MIVVLIVIIIFFVVPFYQHYKDRCKNCGGKLTGENSDDPCICDLVKNMNTKELAINDNQTTHTN